MTFTEIVNEILSRARLSSADATTRVGIAVNRRYKEVTSAIGLIVSRRVEVQEAATLGVRTLTFDNIEKIESVIDKSSGSNVVLTEVTYDDLQAQTVRGEPARQYAIYRMGPDFVTIYLDCIPQTAFVLYAVGHEKKATLSGTDEPTFPESFHDILVEGVLADELRKQEKLPLSKECAALFEKRLSDLRMWIAISGYKDIYAGASKIAKSAGGGGGTGSSASGGTSYTQTGLITFDRDPDAPFAVTSGSAKVDNLDADKLDGYHKEFYWDGRYTAEYFGLVGDNSTDNTAAFNTMLLTVATLAGASATITFGPGVFLFNSKPNAIPTGVVLVGNGSTGSTTGYGTRLIANYTEVTAATGFLTWDGSGPSAGGSGGGATDLQIYKPAAYSGGTAVKLTGTDDNHRAGFMKFDRLVISASGSSTWNKGLFIDGTGLATAGTKGIREVRLTNSVIASCSDVDSNIYLKNSVHFYQFGNHLIPSNSANCGMTVTGASASEASTNIFSAACNIDGNLTIDHCLDVEWHGRIGSTLTYSANSNNVTIEGAHHGSVVGFGTSVNVSIHTNDRVALARSTYVNPLNTEGIFVQPYDEVSGSALFRARALHGATGVPLGFSTTPATGGSGQAYLGYNQDQNTGNNNDTYFRTAYPSFRLGNPLGNGTSPFYVYVAPAGTAGNAITYQAALNIVGSSGAINSATQPRCRVYNSSTQSIPDSTVTVLDFNAETYDVGAMHVTGAGNSKITIPTGGDGLYLFMVNVDFANNATGYRSIIFRKNGATTVGQTTQTGLAADADTLMYMAVMVNLVATDYMEVTAQQTSGGALNSGPGSDTYQWFSAVKLW